MKRRILVSAVLSVLLLAALAANVHAAEVKIIASDGAKYDYFGGSVAISGDYIIVGAPYAYDLDNSGSAYIFKRNGTTWTEQDKINTSDSVGRDYMTLASVQAQPTSSSATEPHGQSRLRSLQAMARQATTSATASQYRAIMR